MAENEEEPSVDDLVQVWRSIIVGENKSWVLFENGACVILPDASGDLAQQAIDLLTEWGPVQVGTPSADFDVVELTEHPGWVVTCHHPDILTYVGPDEASSATGDVLIGLIGRGKRNADAQELRVVHREDGTR